MNIHAFENIVDEVVRSLPPGITSRFDNVTIEVASRPGPDHDPSGSGLLGIYEGIPLSERGVDYFAAVPDRIIIFYRPHMELGLSGDDLRDEVRTTVLHEIGHHLGISDERLTEIGWG
ncbi:MAG: metallopeptidase family protein [Actinomycetota bacterium]